jgi:hypothetical protein
LLLIEWGYSKTQRLIFQSLTVVNKIGNKHVIVYDPWEAGRHLCIFRWNVPNTTNL